MAEIDAKTVIYTEGVKNQELMHNLNSKWVFTKFARDSSPHDEKNQAEKKLTKSN